MKFFRSTGVAMLIAAAVASSAVGQASAFYTGEDLSALESQQGVAIVYPKSMGPEAPAEITSTVAPTTQAPEVDSTTTVASTTEAASEEPASTTTAVPTTEASTTVAPEISSTTTTTTESNLFKHPASVGIASTHVSTNFPGDNVNRVWHFNSQGVNTESVWYSPRQNQDVFSAESAQAVVRVPSPSSVSAASTHSSSSSASSSASASSSSSSSTSSSSSAEASAPTATFLRRAPVLGDDYEASQVNGLIKRTGEEFQDRNLYFPDIARIQSQASGASSSASSSFSSNNYGSKNNFNQKQTSWNGEQQQISPAKAIRKVYLTKSGQRLTESERSNFFSNGHQEPVRVRVVVQGAQAAQGAAVNTNTQNNVQASVNTQNNNNLFERTNVRNELQNNYLERLREANDRHSSAQSSQFFARKATQEKRESSQKSVQQSARQEARKTAKIVEETEYVQVQAPVKSIPKPPVKSLPPPPAPAKVVKQGTKTAPLKRQPVFEQQTLERLEESHPAPEPYSYNFNTDDGSGNTQFRREEGTADGVVRGSYGYTDAWGIFRIVDYIADSNGYRATIRSNEPGLNQKNPSTNAVEEPAQIKIVAEETPAKVLELMRLTRPRNNLV